MDERKFAQIVPVGDWLYAICTDGSGWNRLRSELEWTRIPGPPADPVAKAEPCRAFRHQDGRVMRIDIINHVSPPARKRDHGSRWFVVYWTERDGEDFEGFDTIEDAQVFYDTVIAWMERGA